MPANKAMNLTNAARQDGAAFASYGECSADSSRSGGADGQAGRGRDIVVALASRGAIAVRACASDQLQDATTESHPRRLPRPVVPAQRKVRGTPGLGEDGVLRDDQGCKADKPACTHDLQCKFAVPASCHALEYSAAAFRLGAQRMIAVRTRQGWTTGAL